MSKLRMNDFTLHICLHTLDRDIFACDFRLSPWNEYGFFFILGFLHGVLSEFTDYVSETAVDSVFTGRELERMSKRAASHSFSHLRSKS